MDRNKVIAVVLVVGLVFLFVALLGVVAVTGFVLVFMTPDSNSTVQPPASADIVPITETVTDKVADANAEQTTQAPAASPVPEEKKVETPKPEPKPEPVCGDKKKEGSEQCEVSSDCAADQQCNSSCKCEVKPPQKTVLTDIKIEKLTFWCTPDFGGKKGLAAKIISFKNSGSSDFSYDGTVKVSAVTGETKDSVVTKNAFKFNVKAGKTIDIYQKDIFRDTAPYVFLGAMPTKTKFTVDLGNDRVVEYEQDLKAGDFLGVGCPV